MALTDAQLLERLRKRRTPAGQLLGLQVLELDSQAGFVRVSFEGKPEFCNPMGNVQGGLVAAMLDEAAALAALAKAQMRIVVPTLEFKTTFIAAARLGPLFAEGRCVKLGKRVAFLEAELFDPEAKLLARMSLTAMPVAVEQHPLLSKEIEGH